MMEAIEA